MRSLWLKFIFFIICLSLFSLNLSAQPKILASLDFDIRQDGFAFKNYKNEGESWKDDIGAEDLIRMFGVKAVCKSGNSSQNCVMKASARKWIEYYLEAMSIGRCEGIAVASLRFHTELAFKKRVTPNQFQNGADSVFRLQRQQNIENYIAYYWITQTFDEISIPTKQMAERGPVKMVEILIDAINNQKDTYLFGIKKYDRGRIYDGHAIAPIAVEDAGNQYKIHVYDNNFPGEVRYLYINKTGTQQWFYNGTANPKAKPNYVGDFSTKTLDMTGTSWREGRCFDASFAEDDEKGVGCGIETSQNNRKSIFQNASFTKKTQDEDGEDAEFFLTGEGDMLVIENEDRLGFDPRDGLYHEEIEGGNPNILIGGFEEDLQHYTMPYQESEEPYMIIFSGRNLDEESTLDFVFAAPGFTVGFDSIRLDPNEFLIATISHDGEQISFTATNDGETPEVFFAFDADDEEEQASYITEIGGVELSAEKTLVYNFDFENGKLFFSDDDGNEDEFDIELIRLNTDGTEDVYEQDDLKIGSDKYQMDFGDWKGDEDTMCFRDDDDQDGDFNDEECDEEPNEDGEPDGN